MAASHLQELGTVSGEMIRYPGIIFSAANEYNECGGRMNVKPVTGASGMAPRLLSPASQHRLAHVAGAPYVDHGNRS